MVNSNSVLHRPANSDRWLTNWDWSSADSSAQVPPTPYSGNESVPVTFVTPEDAQNFCESEGGRLPEVWEWRYAAGGFNGTASYPWGNQPNTSNYPSVIYSRDATFAPRPVTEHAGSGRGDSPFGVSDLVGNVYQWSSEFVDDHTKATLILGGSNYRPVQEKNYGKVVQWYVDLCVRILRGFFYTAPPLCCCLRVHVTRTLTTMSLRR